MSSTPAQTYRIPNAVPRIGGFASIAAGVLMIAGFARSGRGAEENSTFPIFALTNMIAAFIFTLTNMK